MEKFIRLFVVPEDEEKKVPENKNISFPTRKEKSGSHSTQNKSTTVDNTVPPNFEDKVIEKFKQTAPLECTPYLNQIMEMYEKGFEGLNQPGIEFYEFFEAVVEGGINEPLVYKMALKILSKQEPNMTKNSLISQSQFYIDELNKVYNQYKKQGVDKKSSIEKQCESEIDLTNQEIDSLTKQMESLQKQIEFNKQKLKEIPKKYTTELNEIDCKLMANEEAAKRIIKNIQTVVSGINSNL